MPAACQANSPAVTLQCDVATGALTHVASREAAPGAEQLRGGTQGLRVVDASVFPKIPGYFIVSAVYMVSEKASDVVMEDA